MPGDHLLTLIGLCSAAFGVSVAGALLPLISVELFVVGMALSGPELPWWLLALVIATGQLGGKLLYYYAARGTFRVPQHLVRLGRALRERGILRPPDFRATRVRTSGRWRRLLRRFRVLCRRRPFWAGLFLLISAVLSLPPFAATSAVAGWARVSLSTFVVTAFLGRYVRFASLAVAPTLAVAWMS